MKKRIALAFSVLSASTVSAANYLQPVIDFVNNKLAVAIRQIGTSLAILMFMYGAAQYIYNSDDPGARKKAMGICVASIVALIIIQVADDVIHAIGSTVPTP